MKRPLIIQSVGHWGSPSAQTRSPDSPFTLCYLWEKLKEALMLGLKMVLNPPSLVFPSPPLAAFRFVAEVFLLVFCFVLSPASAKESTFPICLLTSIFYGCSFCFMACFTRARTHTHTLLQTIYLTLTSNLYPPCQGIALD